MTSIVTKTGDRGETGLFGGKRIAKDALRIHAYGSVDELNSVLGVALADAGMPSALHDHLKDVQSLLFILGADLATPMTSSPKTTRIKSEHLDMLEQHVAELEQSLTPLTTFIVPGGTSAASHLHHARTVCRRAERWIVSLSKEEALNEMIIPFVNRLSDDLFLCARKANAIAGTGDVPIKHER